MIGRRSVFVDDFVVTIEVGRKWHASDRRLGGGRRAVHGVHVTPSGCCPLIRNTCLRAWRSEKCWGHAVMPRLWCYGEWRVGEVREEDRIVMRPISFSFFLSFFFFLSLILISFMQTIAAKQDVTLLWLKKDNKARNCCWHCICILNF